MTLERLQDGSHVFHPPERPYVGTQDALGRTAPPGSPSTRPVGPVKVSPPVTVKQHDMKGYELVAFQATIYDVRGTWQQEGPLDSSSHANFAETSLVGLGPNKARHAFKVNVDPSASGDWVPPAATSTFLLRMVTAFYANKLFFTMGRSAVAAAYPPVVWGETSSTDPTPAQVTTYVQTAGHLQIACMALVTTGGADRLWIGYIEGAGAALGIDAYADATLATPVVVDPSTGHLGTFSGVSGIIQAPNGDILIATTLGDLRLATNNTAALGAISFTTIQAQALGLFPYAVGKCSLANYAPGALWWCSQSNATPLFFAGFNFGDNTPQGHLVLSSYDALTLDPIDFPDLPFVTFATIYRGGVAACDRRSHFWYTGRRMVPMDGGEDRPEDSHKHRLCCGHRVVGDKFMILEAEVDDRFVAAAPKSAYNTKARLIEFDPYREMTRPVTPAIDLGFGGISNGVGGSLMVGAVPELPWSPNTRNAYWFSIWEGLLAIRNQDFGRFWYQYQQDIAGSDTERSTDQPTTGGQEYETSATHETVVFTHPTLGEGWEYTPLRAMGPQVEQIQKGGPAAYMDVSMGGYDADGAGRYRLSAGEPDTKYPSTQFGDWPSRTWSTALQLVIESFLSAGYTHWTTNPLPVTVEIIARRPLAKAIKL